MTCWNGTPRLCVSGMTTEYNCWFHEGAWKLRLMSIMATAVALRAGEPLSVASIRTYKQTSSSSLFGLDNILLQQTNTEYIRTCKSILLDQTFFDYHINIMTQLLAEKVLVSPQIFTLAESNCLPLNTVLVYLRPRYVICSQFIC